VGMSRHVYAAVKKCVLSLLRKDDKELVLRMSIGSEFQTFGAATLNARFAVSVRVLGTISRRASVDRSDRIAIRTAPALLLRNCYVSCTTLYVI